MTTGPETFFPIQPKPGAHEPPPGPPARRERLQPAARRKSNGLPFIVGAVLVVLLIIGVWRHVARNQAEQQFEQANAQTVVNVATVHRSSKSTQLVLPGSVEAFQATTLYARSNGFLGKWLVDIGDDVNQGQTLAVIETPDLDQQLRQAQGTLSQATANAQIAHVTAVRWQELFAQKVV